MANAFFREDHIIHERHRALNNTHTALLIAGSLALLAFTAWAIAGVTGIVYAVMFGAISLMAARRVSPAMVLRMYKAKPVNAANWPRGHEMITALARRAELPVVPKLYVVPSKMMNAFAVGRLDDSAVAVTDALIRQLTARELAGVMAHEVTHIRNEDIKVMSIADMVSRFTSTLSTIGIIAILFNISGFFGTVPWLGISAMMFAPTIGSLLQLALSRTREFDADYGAALLTGDPDGLSMALRKLEAWQQRRLEAVALPVGRISQPSMLRSHPPTDQRIDRLNALKNTLVAPPPADPEPSRKVRRSPVPRVGVRFGREIEAAQRDDWMALSSIIQPPTAIHEPEDADCAACEESLAPPESERPRIHVMRGGAWW
ncbi:MAG: zinc metalloprotease HtpX [Pseudomonadota bacterium]